MRLSRRTFLAGLALTVTGVMPATVRAARPSIIVYKDPGWGCCTAWVGHLREKGFTVDARDVADVGAVKRTHGVPPKLDACHTALVDGYVIEGHVPADVIDQLLRERPKIAGLAVLGMPVGSPGMEAAGGKPERYDVLAFDAGGGTRVFARR